MIKKPGSRPQTAPIKKPAPPLPRWKKLLALPRQTLIFGGGAVALVIILSLFLFSGSPRKEASTKTSPQAGDSSTGPGGENFLERPIGPQTPPPQMAPPPGQEERLTIQSIRFHPSQPTKMDNLKAEVVTTGSADPSLITYTYAWKVNNITVADATGDTLNLATFKKRDLVTVTVTPYEGDKAGFPVDSPIVLIAGASPSLDLQTTAKKTKVGEPLELQLVSLHPDSDSVTFTLEAPLVPGMTIDSRTGKITWILPPNQRGTIRFGAAVEDTDKTKVTKTFDITME